MCRTDLPVLVGMGAVASCTFPGWRACGGLGRPWLWRRACLGLWPSYLIRSSSSSSYAPLRLPARVSRIQICHLHHVKGRGVPGATVVMVNRENYRRSEMAVGKRHPFLKRAKSKCCGWPTPTATAQRASRILICYLHRFKEETRSFYRDASGKSQIEIAAPWC